MADAAAVAREWIAAVNPRYVERLVALADPELEVHTPRGIEHGHDSARVHRAPVLWRRASHRADPDIRGRRCDRRFCRTDLRSVDAGETMHSYPSAAVFQLRYGRMSRLALHGDLSSALADAGFDEHEHAVPIDEAGAPQRLGA